MKPTTLFRIAYHVEKFGIFLITLFPYFSWKTWRAKSYFKTELLRNGIPEELAASLASSYDNGNKNLLKSAISRNA